MLSREIPNPGSLVLIRNSVWKVDSHKRKSDGNIVTCRGVSGLTKGKTASFVVELEKDFHVLDPAAVYLVEDKSNGFRDTKLFLEAAFRSTPPSSRQPLTLGRAAMHDLEFQHLPVQRALGQDRVRLLIADDVGLGKTLEAGLITSELILRGRADRILVVTTRSMLTQFQKEFWTRFSIPLSRLDSSAIRRMRNEIPAHYNVFDQFDRSIVSIDTLKKDSQIRKALEDTRWDLVIIDEAHNAAKRTKAGGSESLRAKLAKLLSRRADALLLLTATPHDGSQESFASLIEMLDPTRVPNPNDLKRVDIEDLVIRRFRSSPEVIADLKEKVPGRQVFRRAFPLSDPEDHVYNLIAELRLDLDEDGSGRRKAIDLFRTTLAKAVFSSPAACLATVEGRLARIASGQARGTDGDVVNLRELADALRRIEPSIFSKYQDLLALLRDMRWDGKAKRDRLVIFSERIRTVEWLAEHLARDLNLPAEAIGRIDGGSVEADEKIQKLLEDFGQEGAPIRILLASDMASEGLNLHFQCHRLIHFDLPWSLLRFQQRNGRIDRYGQDRKPEIYYFIGESSHERVRDMWVLEKLVEKDQAAQDGVGDPAVFLGAGDADLEEEIVAEAVANAIGADAFDREMESNALEAGGVAHDDDWDVLFGDFSGVDHSAASAADLTATDTYGNPPRLYPDTFSYSTDMVQRLALPEENGFRTAPKINSGERVISIEIPDDMKSNGSFGYAKEGDVDDRFMPVEAVGKGNRIELTDRIDVIDAAIQQARTDERAWPSAQYLWDVHPILSWFSDRAENFFPNRGVPVCGLKGRLASGEIAVILHGAIPNQVGTPVVDLWGVVRIKDGLASPVETVGPFLDEIALAGDVPNRQDADIALARKALPKAVDVFQSHLVAARRAKAAEVESSLDAVLDRLAQFEARFRQQISFDFSDVTENGNSVSIAERRRMKRRDARSADIDEMFGDWERWFRETSEMVDDPNPYVDVKAVFVG